ncbi:hypothetical protein SL034_004228 [Vibrio harveyi]|nr:hypothetical protein [Vibrio harveyi]
MKVIAVLIVLVILGLPFVFLTKEDAIFTSGFIFALMVGGVSWYHGASRIQ